MAYVCEQCGRGAALCVSDWGYIAALCEDCMRDRQHYLKLPGSDAPEGVPPVAGTSASA